ncbi:MAG: SpoIVB peptidase [Clostridia bacterium]|nr:SpoIVB peptidase [Clostridia bacterium]
MLKKSVKIAFILLVFQMFSYLALVGLGDLAYPDVLFCHQGEMPAERGIFSLAGEDALPASAGTGGVLRQNKTVLALGFLPVKTVQVQAYPKTEVVVGGELFGVRLRSRGLLVTALGEVETASGSRSPALEAGLKKGDLLLTADGVTLSTAAELSKVLAKSEGRAVTLALEREGKPLSLSLTPVSAADEGGYRAGIWVRDGAAGIGTVTFRDPVTGVFGGLGHGVCDGDTGLIFPLKDGDVAPARVIGIRKGENGAPGELRGRLEEDDLGDVLSNTSCGIFGKCAPLPDAVTVPLGFREEVTVGDATILCTLTDGEKREYAVRIEEIPNPRGGDKNMVICVTDPALLAQTGGIVQGMSGSPILQNGKLVGAVTHVLVGDPARGYGIFIENMLKNMPE